jgi:5-(carboxyamino)imidazole ribonucleotide synthase
MTPTTEHDAVAMADRCWNDRDTPKRDVAAVGIVGGGQLGRMLFHASMPLGIDVRVLAAASDDPAAAVGPNSTVGPLDGRNLVELAATVDVVTFEREDIDPRALDALASTSSVVRPSVDVLRRTGDKLAQRRLLLSERIGVIPAIEVDDSTAMTDALRIFPPPVVLKVPRGGFDGRGVRFARSSDDAVDVAAELGWPLLVEPYLQHQAELSVLVARRPGGEAVAYPVVRTVHVDGVCRIAEVPSGLPDKLEHDARVLAIRIADALDVVGLLAVEMFLMDGVLVVNELAARPHNSGHLTIDACATSQFENHLRAILDWPLGPPELTVPAATMVNVLAADASTEAHANVPVVLADPRVRVHLYNKAARPGRKIGHVTVVGDTAAETRPAAIAAADLLSTARTS